MDVAALRTKAAEFAKKYKFVAIILMVGIVLMALPTERKEESSTAYEQEKTQQTISINDALAEILCKIEGAGNVKVLLTVASGTETIYQTDDRVSVSENNSTTQIDTVTVTDSSRNETGLIKQVNPPTYQGAIILCQGANSASIRLAIVDAVSKVTGLSSDHISVLKMK